MKKRILPLCAVLLFLLVACAGPVGEQPPPLLPAPTAKSSLGTPPPASPTIPIPASGDLTRLDEQGNVIVEVRPLNLNQASEALEFEVVMDTHSVDLSMDLAALSSLTTDTGAHAQVVSWDGTPGGHHVGGKLIFYVMQDGKSMLEGATTLTLTIIDVYAPTRTFEWDLR